MKSKGADKDKGSHKDKGSDKDAYGILSHLNYAPCYTQRKVTHPLNTHIRSTRPTLST